MIDLEKERKDFEMHLNYMTDRISSAPFYMENGNYVSGIINSMWSVWKKRAELAQDEINHLKTANHHLAEINDDISNTILYLREKLAKYESKDVVTVPREPTKEMIEIGESWHSYQQASSNDSKYIYKAMIEVGEVK